MGGVAVTKPLPEKAGKELEAKIHEVLSPTNYRRYLGQMDPVEPALRRKDAMEFKARYGQGVTQSVVLLPLI